MACAARVAALLQHVAALLICSSAPAQAAARDLRGHSRVGSLPTEPLAEPLAAQADFGAAAASGAALSPPVLNLTDGLPATGYSTETVKQTLQTFTQAVDKNGHVEPYGAWVRTALFSWLIWMVLAISVSYFCYDYEVPLLDGDSKADPKVLGSSHRQRYQDEPKKLSPEEWQKAWRIASYYYLQPSWVEQECALYYTREEFFESVCDQMQRDDTRRRPINARMLGMVIFHFLEIDASKRKKSGRELSPEGTIAASVVDHLSELAHAVRVRAPSASVAHSHNTHDLHRPQVHTKILQKVQDVCEGAKGAFHQALQGGRPDTTSLVHKLVNDIVAGLDELQKEGVFDHEEKNKEAIVDTPCDTLKEGEQE